MPDEMLGLAICGGQRTLEGMRRGASEMSKTLLASVPVAVAIPAAGLAVCVLRPASPRFSASACFAAIALVLLLGFFALTRRSLPRAGAVAAVSSLSWSVAIAFGAAEVLLNPTIHANDRVACGTGLMSMLVLLVPIGAVVLFGAGLALGLAAAHRWTDGPLHRAASIAMAIAAIAVAFALPKWGRADSDTYLSSLAVVGTVESGGTLQVRGRELRYVSALVPVRGAEEKESPSITDCRLEGIADAASAASLYAPANACPRVQVRVDPAGDLAFAFVDYGVTDSRPWSWTPRIAFRTGDGRAFDFSAATVSDRIAAPIGWRIAAIVGTVAAAVLLFFARRIRRRAAARAGREGHHRGDGWVDLAGAADDAPVRIPAAASLAIGPIVLFGAEEAGSTYRDSGLPTFTRARSGALETETDLAASLAAIALSAAVLGALPLVVARFVGI